MTDTRETVHVVWGESRAESVRDALRLQGDRARVIALDDLLSLGPIDPLDRRARWAWAKANLRCDSDPDGDAEDDADGDPWGYPTGPDRPWRDVTAASVHPVYWVCLSDASEHAGFLAFAARMAGRAFDIVDATGLSLTTSAGRQPVWSLGLLRPEEIVASGLPARRRPLSAAEREAAAGDWARLCRENAPVRVVRDGRLVSAPLTHYDAVLARQAMREPELLIKLVARALDHLNEGLEPLGQGCSHEFLFARVLALGEAGALVVAGPGPGMRDYTVRLPDAPTPSPA